MPKEAVFTMKLEQKLRADFMTEAEAIDRPASQVVRDLMREFVRRQREAREHLGTSTRGGVSTDRVDPLAGAGVANAEAR